MKKLSAISTFIMLCSAALAGNPLKISGTANLESAYLWRGEKVCEINFNPILEASIGGFTAQAFAYLPFDGSYKEIDLDLSYTLGPVSLHVADYFCRFADFPAEENYFNYNKASTNHLIEGQLCPTLNDLMDCSLPCSSFHGIFQARVLEWVAIAFSGYRE